MICITASDRQAMIRLASVLPEGSNGRRSILNLLTRSAKAKSEDWTAGKKFRHPDTGNEVVFSSLPDEEQEKLNAAHAKKTKEDEEDQEVHDATSMSLGSRIKRLFKGIKGISKPIADSVLEAGEEVQNMVLDTETRKASFGAIAKKIKSGTPIKNMIKAGKSEAKEIYHALGAAKKIFKKPPGPFSKEDKAALYSAGAYAAGTVLAAIPPGGAIMAAAALGKSFALHVGIKAVSHVMDKGFLHFEWGETLHHAFHLLSHVASEKSGEDSKEEGKVAQQKALFEGLARVVGDMLKDLDDDDVQEILKGAKTPKS